MCIRDRTKPFDWQELVANLTAIVRRHNGHSDSVISTGPIAINLNTRTVSVAGEKFDLTGKEVQILELLALRKGATISKTHLNNHLYNGRDELEMKIIDVFVCKLRKKLSDHVNGKNFIQRYGDKVMLCGIIRFLRNNRLMLSASDLHNYLWETRHHIFNLNRSNLFAYPPRRIGE